MKYAILFCCVVLFVLVFSMLVHDKDFLVSVEVFRHDVPLSKPSGVVKMEKTCHGPASDSVWDDPCYVRMNDTMGAFYLCGCKRYKNSPATFTYNINQTVDKGNHLTPKDFSDNVVYIFIHVNKAGGQTIKSAILSTVQDNKWSGGAYGSGVGWNSLALPSMEEKEARKKNERKKEVNGRRLLLLDDDNSEDRDLVVGGKTKPFYNCGKPANELSSKSSCPTRMVWGGASLGLCENYKDQPCVYMTNLREPISRAFSEYNYFCLSGAEKQKKWLDEWKVKGECPLNIVEYFEQGFGSKSLLEERLTRGCDRGCGVAVAKKNLEHPCMKYFILEHLSEDLLAFNNAIGNQTPLAVSFEHLVLKKKHKNATPMKESALAQKNDTKILKKLHELLKDDIEIYQYALSIRKLKAKQSYVSCNPKQLL